MPGFNGTGPQGMGPRTGGGFGFCSPGAGTTAGGSLRGIGRGGLPWGGSRGRGFLGFCRGFFGAQYMTPQDEEAVFADRVSVLERELAAVREDLASLKKDAKSKAE